MVKDTQNYLQRYIKLEPTSKDRKINEIEGI